MKIHEVLVFTILSITLTSFIVTQDAFGGLPICDEGFEFDPETGECVEQIITTPVGENAYASGSTTSGIELDHGAIGLVNFESADIIQVGGSIIEEGGGLSGLTFDSNGNLFGSSVFSGGFGSSSLYQIDPISGDGTLINTIAIFSEATFTARIRDLATQPETDALFGIGNVQEGGGVCEDFNSLLIIDSSTASADCIGPLEINEVEELSEAEEVKFGGIAFFPNGTLFAAGQACFDFEDDCIYFLASYNPDASYAGFFLELDNFLDGLGIRESDGAFFGTGGEGSIQSIDLETGETPTVAGFGDYPADIAFFTFPIPPDLIGGKSSSYEEPTLGVLNDGRLILSDGFCFDKFCMDVTDYFNHLPIRQVNTGSTHTVSLTAYCSSGSTRCNYASVGAAPPGTNINAVEWNVILQRIGISNDWKVTKDDPNGMLGDVTGTVQVVDASRIQYTFNIQFIAPTSIGTLDGNAEPPEDNLILVTEIRDSNRGVGRNIFNEGVFVNDIYAYPQVDSSYAVPVEVEQLCINEDPTDRNTCTFAQVKQWTIKQAQETLEEIYKANNQKRD